MGEPSLAEGVILLVLIAVSVALFWKRFRPVVRIINSLRREPGFQLGALAPRVGQFVWEVLLQGKVVRDRPLPGIAHAFVFWGFLAFGLVTASHIAEGFGLRLLARAGAAGQMYYSFVALWAVAVAVSITGLFWRRFFVQPRWLGEVSAESGIIAGLIFLLMITYLLRMPLTEGTLAAKANWWAHTLALLIFLPLIPHTKHLHLLLSPAAIFTKRSGFSQIPPLDGDEDVGLVTRADITNLDALQAFSCVECGRCTEQCPAFNTGKVLNPKQVILGLRDYLRDGVSTQPIVGAHVLEEAIFQCTTCGGCEESCPVGIQHLPVIIGLRRGRVNTGEWNDSHGTKLFLALEKNGNSLGFAASERAKFLERAELPLWDGTQEYCLWLGCMGAYDPQGRETVQALAKVLNHLGVTFGVLKKERCNGDPARRLGNDLLFGQLAESGIETLQAAGVTAAQKMVSICPHCVRTLGTDWADAGTTFVIEHHTELLARFAERLPKPDEAVVYHDPCYLGRYRGVYDPPRELLGTKLIEPGRTREKSFCCGAGGGMMFLGEEKGERVNVNRVRELVATGVDTVAAACPFCHSMFRDALGTVTDRPVKLLDVAQIVAAGLPSGPSL